MVTLAALLDIGEVAARSGLAPSALRFYERRGLIRPADRRGGRRAYRPDVLNRLAVIDMAQEAGFTLSETAELLRTRSPNGRRARLHAKLDELEERIRRAEQARDVLRHALACPSASMERCETFQALVAARASAPRARRPDLAATMTSNAE
jgi:DNA-binding transcriptional MerR regulator